MMQCFNCGFSNADTARFCQNCGQPLERDCPNCGSRVSTTARFCPNCGYNLAGAFATQAVSGTPFDPLAAMRHAAPPTVAAQILAQRGRMEGERKLVTALFTDIVGSTALAEQMDPEDWREIVAGAYQRIGDAVYRFEGTIAALLGDGVLAFFGAPLAHEDDAERAIRAALDIVESIGVLEAELRRAQRVPHLQVRVGMHTGLVVVGNIGTDLHMEYQAVGDTVNLAARMQTAADPGAILVTAQTRRLTAGLFEFEDGGEIQVKGKAEPVQVYRVLSEHKGAVRVRGIAGLSSPLVGREREYRSLLRVTDDLRAGHGAIVSIIGEAGLGKSRLVAEWRMGSLDRLAGSNVRWVEARCLSYGTTMAHHLSADVLRALIGLSPESGHPEAIATLRSALDRMLGAGAPEVYPFLAHLLGLPLAEDESMRIKYLDGPALQAQYVAAIRSCLRQVARESPLVLVCEDLHWADPSSVELGIQLLSLAVEEPLVYVFVTRADNQAPGWRLVTRAREVAGLGSVEFHLAPLSEADSRQLVNNLLEMQTLPEAFRNLILEKAEGNPFFVEEVIRMLIDRGILARRDRDWIVTHDLTDIEIPDTLQGVLAARIDRLPEDAKRVLQIAAVIGRKFQVRVLEKVLEAGI